MKLRLATVLAATSVCVLVAGCATPVERANEKNDLLAAAGFHIVPVTTDAQRVQLETLPPNRVVQKIKDGKPVFLYADPYSCGCLYVGDENAWDNYKREQIQQKFLDQESMNAQMNENAAWNWSIGHPGWWMY
ncbi:hypothetical protein [Paraburkholderia sp. DHOC27]|uniref:hypothetical protein n=1 Tax=Paraburkholderia sp. DHOC27 TaxID=2303330 RepID=UPI000E3DD476|nr:hypothetical protein [Paraburkholderia sp. DHOC27]RFU48371.1 hypothetical protein D0B32_00540 [Paraburkholderia sp. DHOC27]